MKASIIIPALNEEKDIQNCLISLKNQTYKNIEIILGDGNSEDKTREIAKKYTDKIIIEKKRSCAYQRNAGISIASGDILIFTDADSISDKYRIEKIMNAFKKDLDLIAIQGMCLPNTKNKIEKFLSKMLLSFLFPITFFLKKPFAIGSNIAARKEIVKKIGGFDTTLKLSDDTLFIKNAQKIGKVKIIYDSIVYTSTRRIKKWGLFKSFVFFTKEYFNFYFFKKQNEKKIYEEVR